MALREHDFVEIEYTGKIKESGEVFDTTDAKVAKEHGIFDKAALFGPVTVCLGEGFVLHGLEERLIGKELGEHDIDLTAEEGFGKKSAKLIQLVPTAKFTKQEIVPTPGLQINVDGMLGTVRTVTGGRTIVDFNHPLSGKELLYKVKILRSVTDEQEKANAILKWLFRIPNAELKLEDKKLTIIFEQMPQEFQQEIANKVKQLTKITEIVFEDRPAKQAKWA